VADYLLTGHTPHPAVVRIVAPERAGTSLGSGVLVDANRSQGLVLTNWHVVRDSKSAVLVQFPDGFQSAGTVVRWDEAWDLAAIVVWKPAATPIPVAEAPPQIGEQLTIAGFGRGVTQVPEGRGIFGRMTIMENLQMGAYIRDGAAQIQADIDRIFTTFPRLKERRSQLAGTLSGGEQQMLAMGRALMAQPQLLLLDEPSMGLSPLMVDKIFEVIQGVAAQGMTVLLVEQNARRALQIADRAYVMESGLITLSGAAKDLLDDPKVRAAYLGE
jgi:ABC-type branched-subunit amino acid transport system ATPase component